MKKIIAANWKMVVKKENLPVLAEVLQKANKETLEVLVCPSFVHLAETAGWLRDAKIGLGAQNCFWEEHGAYTGEISAWDLQAAGCNFVLVGHSERRKYFGETDETVNKKITAAWRAGLTPILCVGETKAERDAGKALPTVGEQLQKGLADVVLDDKRLLVAYEPVWAIGTGDFCDPEKAVEVHAFIKEKVEQLLGRAVAVLYGGSVDDKNVAEFLKHDVVDGVLVGGASTKPEVLEKLLANSI